ncbi:unnamed protein product [Alopecurus aequalis]
MPDPAMQKWSCAQKGAKGSGEPKSCSSASPAKKARTANKTTAKCNPEHEEEEEICNVFTLEMDNLECDICFLPYESQVYSCKNGHAACASCCINMERKCPSCNQSIGDFRCRAMEKILAGMTRPCRFMKHGCGETVRYTETRNHEEELCRYAPYRCPFDGCAYHGRRLYGHILDAHAPGATSGLSGPITMTLKKSEPFRALLHPDGESVFLLLNGGNVLTGRSLALVRVCCPYPEEGDDYERVETQYIMMVKGVDDREPGSFSLTASGRAQFVRRLEGYDAKEFMFVPDAFWGSFGSVTVTFYL